MTAPLPDPGDHFAAQPSSSSDLLRPPPTPSLLARLATGARDRLIGGWGHTRHRWYIYLPLAAMWGLAYVRLCWDPVPHTPLLFNVTGSLPYRVAWLRAVQPPLRRGDFVVFSFQGPARHTYPGLDRQPFFKVIRGLPGDRVSVERRMVFINGEPVGLAKPFAADRRALEPISPTVIPAGHYFVQGLSPDSFDSRYRSSGLIRAEQILGIAQPLL